MTRLEPARFPWTGANVLFCSAAVAATYLALKILKPWGDLLTAGAALQSACLLAAAFVVPPCLVLLVGWLRKRRGERAGASGPPDGPSYDPRALWLTRGGLSRDVIAGVVLGLLLGLMNGISLQRGIGEFSPRTAGALARLVYLSSGLADVSMLLVALGFVAPVAEEVFFRGVLYTGLRRQVPVIPAVLLSAAAFAAAHYDSMRAHSFLLAVVAALLVEFTGSLVPAILAHVGVNTGFVLFLANGGLLAKAAPAWAVLVAFGAMNVLFFLLGQPLFGKGGEAPAAGADVHVPPTVHEAGNGIPHEVPPGPP